MISLSCYDGIQDDFEEGRTYSLRERGPGGGWIFYINPNYKADGWRYLEAAPEDQSTGKIWINSGSAPDPQSTLNGYTTTSIGAGKANTEAVIAQAGHAISAAKLCRDYQGGGYTDWYLPSRDEQELMWENLYVWDVAGLVSGNSYWSSSEYDATRAWYYRFNDHTKSQALKTANAYVRSVRQF